MGFQVNTAWQLREWPRGRLYLEFAVTPADAPADRFVGSELAQAGVRSVSYPLGVIFLTPGLRYHYNLSPRVVVYAAAGAGAALRCAAPPKDLRAR